MDLKLTIKRPAKNAEPGNCWMHRPIGVQEVESSILGSGSMVFVETWSRNNFYGHSIQVGHLSVTEKVSSTA